MPTRVTKRVETLLSDSKINTVDNDYRAYGRPAPGGGFPAPLFGQQYKFGKAEALKLTSAIESRYSVATQKSVLKEIYSRSTNIDMPKGTVELTAQAASALNALAAKLGLSELTFVSGQAKPLHPVG